MTTDDNLKYAFEFGVEDLAANQQGKITDWQRRRLREKQSQELKAFAVPIAAGITFGVIGKFTALFALIMLAVVAYLTYTTFVRWRNLQLESQMADGVISIHGWVTKKRIRSRYSTSYRLEINGSEFKINLAQFDSLKDGTEYQIHYAPYSLTILSLEPEDSRANQRGYLAERLGKL